jgi:hypothetical protein
VKIRLLMQPLPLPPVLAPNGVSPSFMPAGAFLLSDPSHRGSQKTPRIGSQGLRDYSVALV